MAFGPVGFGMDGPVDVKLGADQLHMVGPVDLAVVIVNADGFAIEVNRDR